MTTNSGDQQAPSEYFQPIQVEWPSHIPSNVLAITTTRNTFASISFNNVAIDSSEAKSSAFNYFNLGTHVNDEIEHVIKNREKLLAYCPDNVEIQWLNQIHGNQVAIVEECLDQPITADAAITSKKNIALAVMTADCLPILLANKEGTEIAVIHAGWRPLAKEIISNTIEKMVSNVRDLNIWLGPCISSEHFEVGSEVRKVFISKGEHFEKAFLASKFDNKYFANLHQIASIQLRALGIKNISSLSECTFDMSEKYYSYRRDQKTGRMASVICIF